MFDGKLNTLYKQAVTYTRNSVATQIFVKSQMIVWIEHSKATLFHTSEKEKLRSFLTNVLATVGKFRSLNVS